MKRKNLLLTLLMALAVPLAVNAQVERSVTVYNGISTNTHIPVDGSQGVSTSAKNQFIMNRVELSAIVGKPITKMAFHTVAPTPTPNTGNHLPYNVMLAEVDVPRFTSNALIQSSEMTNAVTVATNVSLDVENNMLVIEFRQPFTFSGTKNLLVQFTCSNGSQWYYSPWYGTCDLMFYGVDEALAGNIDMGWGIYRHYGFVPKTTFTYQDNANWANTNRPQNLIASADSDGRLHLAWDAPSGYSGGYQTLYSVRPYAPNWDDWSYTPYTADLLTNLTPNTMYDVYVRAYDGDHASDLAMAIISTYAIADLDNDNLTLDFDGAFVHNGITATGNAHRQLETTRYFFMDGPESGYSSYMLRYGANQAVTVNLPGLHYTNATNGIIMEFDLYSATDLQVKFWRQGYDTDLGTFSANTRTHYMVRATDGIGAQNAYFQFVTSSPFSIDNIVIRKAADLLPVIDLTASNITTNSAVISWNDPNVNTHALELYYRPKGYQNGDPHSWLSYTTVTGTSHTLTGLNTYTDYEVMVKANNGSIFENSAVLSFHTMCPPTATPYTMDFTGLSELPQYWRIMPVYPHEYADVVADPNDASNNVLKVHSGSEVYSVAGYYNYFHYALNGNVVLPYFTGLNALQLDFQGASSNSNYTYNVDVKVVSDPSYITSAQTIESFVLTSDMTDYSVNFSNSQYADGFIVLYVYGSNSPLDEQAVFFDNFVVTRAPAPSNLTVNLTNISATLGWTTAAASVELQYRVAGGTWSQSVTPVGNSYTMTGLTAGTEYEAQIRANYGAQNSDWVSFGTFKTLLQEAVALNASNTSYFEDFESNNGNWFFINAATNKWKRFSYNSQFYGNQGYGLRVTSSADNTLNPSWSYTTRSSYTVNGQTEYLGTPATSYAVKTFALSEGHYVFTYKYAVKGVADDDYMRVVLVPAETNIVAGVMPNGFDYQNTPNGWFSLDRGQQLTGYSANYYHWQQQINITLDVYPGGTFEPGNYMIVVLWHNPGAPGRDGQNPPGAIDNVSVTWSELLASPASIAVVESDTEATLSWTVSTCTLTPTGYEVQYEPLGNNGFVDAPIVSTNTNSITLTGLTPNTNYHVRVRSVYTDNGNSIYSDWTVPVAVTTLYPCPTDLTVVNQTSSWANVMWTVGMELPQGKSFHYKWQLTTNTGSWGLENSGLANNSWASNLAPGTYYFRVKIESIYDSNSHESTSITNADWSEPITFTIASWTDPVTIFPLSYDFETGNFVDGLTLNGYTSSSYPYEQVDMLYFYQPYFDGGQAHSGNYVLRFNNIAPVTRSYSLVLPPLRPAENYARISFYWYHGTNNSNKNDGVYVETSTDGTNWVQQGDMIKRYVEGQSGWTKYDRVFEAPTQYNKVYVRLRFVGDQVGSYNPMDHCLLDDLTVNTFKSYQPYIAGVSCGANTAAITLYDNAYNHGWPSSWFHVQYRRVGQTTWTDYPDFQNQSPYTYENTLTLTGLDPNTYYEFRACARVSNGNSNLDWSTYCESYRMWTSDGVFTVSPNHPFENDFEYGVYNWTEGSWNTQYEGGYNSTLCAFSNSSTNGLVTPEINFSNCNNAIVRFWIKGSTTIRLNVYTSTNYTTPVKQYLVNNVSSSWKQYTFSLCNYMNNTIKLEFGPNNGNAMTVYVDDIEVIGNAFDKVYDRPSLNSSYLWSDALNWWPHVVPTANDDVFVNSDAITGFAHVGSTDGNNPYHAYSNNLTVGSQAVTVYNGSLLEVGQINRTGAGAGAGVSISDGGQLKINSPAFVSMSKRIIGYDNASGDDHYYLLATAVTRNNANTMMDLSNISGFTSGSYDLYSFNGNAELEWINYKNTPTPFSSLTRGKGYLYAHAKPTTGNNNYTSFTFTGNILATNVDKEVTGLTYGANTENRPFYNWNLVGNPFPCNAYLSGNRTFYRLEETEFGSRIVLASSNVIAPMEGVFVQATTEAESSVTFTTTEPTRSQGMNFSLHKAEFTRDGVSTGSATLDRTRIQFGEGQNLGHLDLMADPNRLYFPVSGKDMAVVSTQPLGVLPLNFEAAANGTFTLSFENETESLMYCHLIDNLTGADVDLLQQPEYTFNARTSDYASRFKVVFVAANEDTVGDNPTFAFESNGNWVIANEGRATLQVIDLNGRILSSEQIDGCAETRINAAAGVYLIRLVNGDNVRTQKVIVK